MANKQALDATIGFINALAVAFSSPETLATDAGHVNRLMHAESSPIEDVVNSMKLLDKLRKSNEQWLACRYLGCSQVLSTYYYS